MTQEIGLLVVLVFAIAVGFLFGWQLHQKYNNLSKKTFAHSYYRGMSYLLNEQIDDSVDKFIYALNVNSETLEIHLALGNLMRRKGDAAKAIKIHKNLLECRELSSKQQHEAQLELARDYVNAGLLDRAENLFQELIDIDSPYKFPALEHLVEIYQNEKEWSKAIQVANELTRLKDEREPGDLSIAKAHFCCELALSAIERNDLDYANQQLKLAIDFDRSSVRASLITAELAFASGNYNEALEALKKIPQQDPDLINASLDLLCQTYEKSKGGADLLAHLLLLLERYPSNQLVIKVAEKLRISENDYVAADFLAEQLKRRPSIKVLTKLVELHLLHSEGKARENLQLLKQLVDRVIAEKPGYHCVKCGFTGNRLHWLCPGCKTWGSVKLIRGVAGE